MNRIATMLALALALTTGAARAADPAPAASGVAATVEQPRAFGHQLGDVLTQRVLLAHDGRALTPVALPAAARVDLWLERRPARIGTDAQGRRWLTIDYQLINTPQQLTAIALPALRVATTGGPTLDVPAWPLSTTPLTPPQAFGQGDLQPLRPERAVAPLPVHGLQRDLQRTLAALAGVLLAWGGWWWWRNRREARQLPFAQAWHALQRMDDADGPEAWRAVHGALNRTAGRVLHGASLPQLLAAAPHLQPLRPRLEAFYAESTRRFFAAEAGAAPPGTATASLKALCRDLRKAEQGA